MIFASSDHIDPTKRPKLVVTYTLPAPIPVPAISTWGMICLSFVVVGLGMAFIKRSV